MVMPRANLPSARLIYNIPRSEARKLPTFGDFPRRESRLGLAPLSTLMPGDACRPANTFRDRGPSRFWRMVSYAQDHAADELAEAAGVNKHFSDRRGDVSLVEGEVDGLKRFSWCRDFRRPR